MRALHGPCDATVQWRHSREPAIPCAGSGLRGCRHWTAVDELAVVSWPLAAATANGQRRTINYLIVISGTEIKNPFGYITNPSTLLRMIATLSRW